MQCPKLLSHSTKSIRQGETNHAADPEGDAARDFHGTTPWTPMPRCPPSRCLVLLVARQRRRAGEGIPRCAISEQIRRRMTKRRQRTTSRRRPPHEGDEAAADGEVQGAPHEAWIGRIWPIDELGRGTAADRRNGRRLGKSLTKISLFDMP